MASTTVSTPSRFGFIGELLVSQGVISQQQLDVAVMEQKRRGERLGTILIQSGFCDEGDIARCLATQLKLAVVKPDHKSVDRSVAADFDEAFLRASLCVPIAAPKGRALFAVADPFDMATIDKLQAKMNRPVDIVVATPTDILKTIDSIAEGRSKVDEMLASVSAEAMSAGRIKEEISTEELVTNIIAGAVKIGATDIHLEPDGNVFRVRYRVDGILVPGAMINRELAPAAIARVKVISKLDIAEQRLPQDGRARIKIDGADYDLRVSTLPTVVGENVVMRVLDGRRALLPLPALGLSEEILSPILETTKRPHGIMLVCGPTGSGKSTTLYSMLSNVNAIEKKVITVEDPVEYQIPLVRQVQVNSDIGMTFAAALRSILRQDPDVILVGEIRDTETAEISIRAALTGHLVLSTLHTNNALGAIPRLVDMGIDGFLLKSSLVGVLSQRLVRTVCNECRESYQPSDDEIEWVDPILRGSIRELWRGKGCDRCGGSGYAGRIGIHELFRITPGIRALDLRNVDEGTIRRQAVADGFRTLAFDGQKKALQGKTTLEEVRRVAIDL